MHIATLIGRDGPLHQQAKGLVRDPDLPFPVLLAKFKLSWRCNLRCRMCNLWRYAHEGRGAGLDPETVKQALFDLHAQGLKKVHFSGGEVLMYPAFEEIVSFARALDLQVNLTSNGTLITKETARFLVDQRVHTLTVFHRCAGQPDPRPDPRGQGGIQGGHPRPDAGAGASGEERARTENWRSIPWLPGQPSIAWMSCTGCCAQTGSMPGGFCRSIQNVKS